MKNVKKHIFDIAQPFRSAALCLRPRHFNFGYRIATNLYAGKATEFSGQQHRLIVLAFQQTGIMQRYRNNNINTGGKDIAAGHIHHFGKQRGQIRPAKNETNAVCDAGTKHRRRARGRRINCRKAGRNDNIPRLL